MHVQSFCYLLLRNHPAGIPAGSFFCFSVFLREKDFQGFSIIFKEFLGIVGIFKGFLGFLEILLRIFKGFLGFSKDFQGIFREFLGIFGIY